MYVTLNHIFNNLTHCRQVCHASFDHVVDGRNDYCGGVVAVVRVGVGVVIGGGIDIDVHIDVIDIVIVGVVCVVVHVG